MMNRAYSLLTLKAIDDDQRVITGIATTPTADRAGDIVEPQGAQFELPIPFLWQHDSRQPIGHVTEARVTPKGIEIVAKLTRVDEPGALKDRLDEAWQSIKSGLVRGLSIGFKEIEAARIEQSYSYRFLKWLWLELSAVTIPANAEATIQTVKSIDTAQRAASGRSRVVRLPPGASGPSNSIKEHRHMATKSLAEQISAFENTRAAKAARMEEIMTAAAEAGTTLDAAQTEEYDTLSDEVKAIDAHLTRLRDLEKAKAASAKPVNRIEKADDGGAARAPGVIQVKVPDLPPGVRFARLAKVKAIARMDGRDPVKIAEQMYGSDSEVAAILKANEVVPGSTATGNWASALVGSETSAFADFAAYLRPATILGKFGANGVPSLRNVPFREPLISQTGGGASYWVGEGKPKPLTSFNFARTTLEPLKIANIAVLTEENIRSSSPSSEMIVRDSLRDALVEGQDLAFIDPANSGQQNVKPASITNGASAIVSTGTDADAVRLDVRAVMQKFIDANNPPTAGVWIMSAANALALSLMVNALGQPEFSGISMSGGTFFGLPVIVSEHVGDIVALVNASDIYQGDDGDIAVDMSREAALEMKSASLTQDGAAGTGASLVSLWQNNLVALRAERTINWARRRTSAVAYLTDVAWGGAVPAS